MTVKYIKFKSARKNILLRLENMSLSTDPRKWKESIEEHGVICLLSSVGAKNVQSTLSHAKSPGAQKILCACVMPHISEMVRNCAGVSILTSLVRYGTVGTAEKIASEVMKTNEEVWNFTNYESISPEVVDELCNLLDGFVYRTDATGGNCEKIRENLKNSGDSAFKSQFTLPALGRQIGFDSTFCQTVCKGKSSQKAIGEAIISKTMKVAVKKFCENALEKNETNNENTLISDFLFDASAPYLKKASSERPHESFLLSLVSMSDPAVVEKVGHLMKDWPNLHELAEREGYTKILSSILERGNKKNGAKLVKKVFESEVDVDRRISSRKGPSLRLLAIIANTESYLNALNEKIGQDLGMKLRGASTLFQKSAFRSGGGTRKLIEEKLRLLRSSGTKRSRE